MNVTDLPEPDQWCVHPYCGVPILPSTTWRRHTPAERDQLRRLGRRGHEGRGLCTVCWSRENYAGRLDAWPRLTAWRPPGTAYLDEWDHLTEGRHGTARAVLIREVAPRLGMTPKALERALDRRTVAA